MCPTLSHVTKRVKSFEGTFVIFWFSLYKNGLIHIWVDPADCRLRIEKLVLCNVKTSTLQWKNCRCTINQGCFPKSNILDLTLSHQGLNLNQVINTVSQVG